MKTSKRQPPSTHHKLQGVLISTDNNFVTRTPCPQRVQRMQREIKNCLQVGHLEPEHARRMAGKCNFLTGRLFGKVGRAPLKAIYARANSNRSELDKPTKAALFALLDIITSCHPMSIPRSLVPHSSSIIYTDACYLAGECPVPPGRTSTELEPKGFPVRRQWLRRGTVPQRQLTSRMVLPRQASQRHPQVQLQHRLHLLPRSMGGHHCLLGLPTFSLATSTSSAATTKPPDMLSLRE